MELSVFDKMVTSLYTSLEKQSIYQLLCAAMNVDGIRDKREIAVIEEVVKLIGLSDVERVASRSIDANQMTEILRNMGDSKKLYLGKFLANVIIADGMVEKKEEIFFNYMCQTLGIPKL